jgi:hypothetical protein
MNTGQMLIWLSNTGTQITRWSGGYITANTAMYTNNGFHNFVWINNAGTHTGYLDNQSFSLGTSNVTGNFSRFRIGGALGQNDPTIGLGNVDDFRFYDYAADATFVDYIYKLGSSTNVAGLSGATISNLQNAGATISQLMVAGFTIAQLIAEGVTIAQLVAGGVSIAQLVAGGVSIAQLVAGGATISQLMVAGFTIAQLIAEGVTIAQLIAEGVTIAQLVAANVTVAELLAEGVTSAQLVAGGVTVAEILAVGTVPDWTLDPGANHFDQSYVKGFTDVSGSVVIRNDNKLITNADLSLGGNLTINPTPPIILAPYTTLIPNSDLTDTYTQGGITYYLIPKSSPVEISGVSINSLDEIEPISATNVNSNANQGPFDCKIYKYETDPSGNAVTNNWIFGSYQEPASFTRILRVEFTLNGTTPSIQLLSAQYNVNYNDPDTGSILGNGDYTSSAEDLTRMANDSTISTVPFTTTNGYNLTNLSYTVSSMIYQPQGTTSFSNESMTLKSNLFMGEDISANGNVYVGGDLSVNGQFSGNFANGIIPSSAIGGGGGGAIEISGNVLFTGDVSFNGSSVDVNIPPGVWITELIPETDLTDLFLYNGVNYRHISINTADVIHGVSINSLDDIKPTAAAIYGSYNNAGPYTCTAFYKYETGPNEEVLTNNWLVATYRPDATISRACRIEFTLNGTTPSVRQISHAYNTNYNQGGSTNLSILGDKNYTTTAADLIQLFNDTTIGTVLTNDVTILINFYYDYYDALLPVLLQANLIEFNDATTMSTYDDNILSGTFADSNVVFKDSTFASVICEGVATATVTQSSDYRIKQNVTELNETDTVDALVLIQYNNTVSGNHEFGLLAHELQEVYPDLVVGEKDGDEYQRVHYNGLIGVLVKEIQGLKRRMELLNKR